MVYTSYILNLAKYLSNLRMNLAKPCDHDYEMSPPLPRAAGQPGDDEYPGNANAFVHPSSSNILSTDPLGVANLALARPQGFQSPAMSLSLSTIKHSNVNGQHQSVLNTTPLQLQAPDSSRVPAGTVIRQIRSRSPTLEVARPDVIKKVQLVEQDDLATRSVRYQQESTIEDLRLQVAQSQAFLEKMQKQMDEIIQDNLKVAENRILEAEKRAFEAERRAADAERRIEKHPEESERHIPAATQQHSSIPGAFDDDDDPLIRQAPCANRQYSGRTSGPMDTSPSANPVQGLQASKAKERQSSGRSCVLMGEEPPSNSIREPQTSNGKEQQGAGEGSGPMDQDPSPSNPIQGLQTSNGEEQQGADGGSGQMDQVLSLSIPAPALQGKGRHEITDREPLSSGPMDEDPVGTAPSWKRKERQGRVRGIRPVNWAPSHNQSVHALQPSGQQVFDSSDDDEDEWPVIRKNEATIPPPMTFSRPKGGAGSRLRLVPKECNSARPFMTPQHDQPAQSTTLPKTELPSHRQSALASRTSHRLVSARASASPTPEMLHIPLEAPSSTNRIRVSTQSPIAIGSAATPTPPRGPTLPQTYHKTSTLASGTSRRLTSARVSASPTPQVPHIPLEASLSTNHVRVSTQSSVAIGSAIAPRGPTSPRTHDTTRTLAHESCTPEPQVKVEDKFDVMIEEMRQFRKTIADLVTSPTTALRTPQKMRGSSAFGRTPRRSCNPERTVLLRQVRTVMNDCLGIKKGSDILTTEAPDEEQVQGYENDECEGPSSRPMQPYLGKTKEMQCKWNDELMLQFIEQYKATYPDDFIDEATELLLIDMFYARLQRLARTVKEAQPLQDESESKRLARVEEKELGILDRKRNNTRRNTSFHTRLDIASRNRLTSDGQTDKVWEFLYHVVNDLTSGGMSSDDTDKEENGYLVRRLEWRSKRLIQYLQIIDADYNLFNGYGNIRAGNRPRPRKRRTQANISIRKAVPGLPRNFYNDNWYSTLTETQKILLGAKPAIDMIEIEAY